jgi:hypothetical protein
LKFTGPTGSDFWLCPILGILSDSRTANQQIQNTTESKYKKNFERTREREKKGKATWPDGGVCFNESVSPHN